MAKCPKCNAALHIYNVSQFCPSCGVNMRYVNFEENFLREAKTAELSQAVVSMKVARLKAALIGGKPQIVRLVVMLLPLVSLLIPSGSFELSLPYYSHGVQFGILGLYGVFTNGDFDYITAMGSSELLGSVFSQLRLALISLAVPAVFAVLVLLMSILCFISIKNMQKIITAASVLGAVSTLISVFFIFKFVSVSSDCAVLNAKNGFGWIAAVFSFALVAAINIIIDKKGIKPVYAEGIEERAAIYRRVKNGEVKIDDLPQPVVETAETRKIDEEIEKEEALLRESEKEESVE